VGFIMPNIVRETVSIEEMSLMKEVKTTRRFSCIKQVEAGLLVQYRVSSKGRSSLEY
jgi:hypothetical protein